jgi:hypothetical protein
VASGAVSRAFFASAAFPHLADALLCGAPLPRSRCKLRTRRMPESRS